MRLSLEIVSGPLQGQKVVAEEHQVVRVGRTAKADFPTDDGFMSGEHFAVESDGKVWLIRDLKSRNGTKVNDKRVTSVELHEGDRIHAGSTDFIVRIEIEPSPGLKKKLLTTLPPAVPVAPNHELGASEEVADQRRATEEAEAKPKRQTGKRAKPVREKEPPQTKKMIEERPPEVDPSVEAVARVASPKPVMVPVPVPSGLESYEAVTPGGRLLFLLGRQPQPLLALLDATQDKKVLTLLQESGEEFQSLYNNPQSASIAPYLVSFSTDSTLLRKMINQGWGHCWGVYLTCSFPLAQLRDYFRRELMVSLPDGVELFSRFYDPRYFRTFLDTCTPSEAQKFFGPVSSYLMEADKPEIVLEFTRTSKGVEKRGHLLTDLS
jgi:pSer/pThr/pTyr-binding forkhead associated (FHA) protein